MPTVLSNADGLLRGAGVFHPDRGLERSLWLLALIIVAFGPIYGALMGSYHLVAPERLLQMLYSAIKVPLLLFATGLVCLPAFFVLNTVLGLQPDFRRAVHAILAGQAGLAVALASLSPLTRFFYFSTNDYRSALLFNAAMFAVATVAAQMLMVRYYRVLFRRNRNHRIAFFSWLGLYSFVGIQMGWVLRPFVGDPTLGTQFFRQGAFSNAYVVVFRLIFG